MSTSKNILTLALVSLMGSAPFLISSISFAAGTAAQATNKAAVEKAVMSASADAEELNKDSVIIESFDINSIPVQGQGG